MIIQPEFEPFPYIVIDEYFDDIELKEVMYEVTTLEPYAFYDGALTQAAVNDTGETLKSGRGLFLDKLFKDSLRPMSKILRVNRKLFTPVIADVARELCAFYGHIRRVTQDSTLLNYYSSGEEYKPHWDRSTLSAVWFNGQGQFTGGDFVFPEYDVVIAYKPNRMVIFPGCVLHGAKAIDGAVGAYRVSMAQFMGYS